MSVIVKTPPATEPVSLQQALDHLRDPADEDALISELIKVAREHCEGYLQRPLITQTKTLYADCFDGVIELSPNLQDVTEIRYIDTDGVQQVLDTAEYTTDTSTIVGVVYPEYGKTWPDTRNQRNAVEIDFECGYGVAADVPSSIQSAMLLLIGHLFVNRESVIVGVNAIETPMSVGLLLQQYRVISF
jgi:uncharacterized phiE125 gp8 family phage protein